jgi:hypothetical protein
MVKTLHARLVAYLPNGGRLGNLPAPLSWDASIVNNDLGALKVVYSRRTVGGGILKRGLEQGLEIGLEVSDGGAWSEPYNCRYLLIGRSRNAEDVSDTVTLTCQSMGWLANKILNNDTAHLIADGDNKGKRAFLSKNPGTIIRTILDENKARKGAGLVLAPGFDTGKDAAGANWKSVYTLYYSLGTSLNSMLSSMVGGGAIDWRTEGRTLRIWNADSTNLSRDLSGRVHVSMAHDVLEAPEEESIEDLSSDILVEGDNGLIFRESNPAAPTPWGGWESYVSQGGVSDEATAKSFMRTTLASSARVRGQYTRSLLVTNADSLPLVDYRPGDWITAPTVQHGEKVRIQQVTVSLDSNGLKASITLNDKVYDSQVRAAKKIAGITGGAQLAGSEGGRPAPEKDHRVPNAPTGLVVQTDAYISSRGTALGLATLQWAAVSQATDDTAIDISGYRVEYRKSTAGAPWVSGGVTDAQRLTLGIGGLECGQRYEFRVRAVPTYSDRLGDWSNVVVALVASDVTPPSIPSKPILTSKLGVVDVQWDGRNNAGGGMELDFDHVEVGISDSNGNWKYRDSVARDGHCVVTGLEYRVYWFALRSVDHSGNKSDWGVGASITVASAVSQTDLDRLDKDLRDNKTAIDNANRELSQAKQDIAGNTTAIDNANRELDAAQGDIAQAKKDITQAKSDAANAKNEAGKASAAIESAKSDIANAASKAQSALDKANSVGKSLDGLHNVYEGPDDPTTLSGVTVRQGDFWYKTQKYWTRWSGAANDSTSLLADFYTGWEGEPNNSASWLVPLSSRFIGVYVFDGSRWNERNIVAANILASGSVVASNMAANSITTEKLVAGAITTDKVAANAIVAGKIASGAITTDKLAALAVTADKLAANSVVAGKIAANAVNAGNIVSGAITTEKLAALSVTVDKLAANSVNADKIVSGAITADKLAANSVTAVKIAAGTITSDKVAAGQFRGYVFTGAIFQSSEAANTGVKLNSAGLQMWDSNHNQTVHLDGEGKSNLLSGTFQTRASGHRVRISPDYRISTVGGTETFVGDGIEFPAYKGETAYWKNPAIASAIQSNQVGEMGELDLWSGRVTEHDPAAFLQLQSRPIRKGGTGSDGVVSRAFIMANTDYGEPDESKKQRASLNLYGDSPNGSNFWLEAADANGAVGVGANIATGYVYLGGFLGGITNRCTFHGAAAWRAWWPNPGYKIATGASMQVNCTFSPTKYGRYYVVANADSQWAGIIAHPVNTGGQSGFQLKLYNADQPCPVDVYAEYLAYLVK